MSISCQGDYCGGNHVEQKDHVNVNNPEQAIISVDLVDAFAKTSCRIISSMITSPAELSQLS